MGDTYEVNKFTLLRAMERLRLAYIYVLKDSVPDSEMLPEDFKPHKWDGYEEEFAKECLVLHRAIMDEIAPQAGVES